MKHFFAKSIFLRLLFLSLFVLAFVHPVSGQNVPHGAVKIVAPDGVSTRVLAEPREGAEIVDTALNGVIFETMGARDGYVEVKIPDKSLSGFVLKTHTMPWETPGKQSSAIVLIIFLVGLVAAIVTGAVFMWFRMRKKQEAARLAAEIPAAIKRAEENFRCRGLWQRHSGIQELCESPGGRSPQSGRVSTHGRMLPGTRRCARGSGLLGNNALAGRRQDDR